MTEFLAKLFKSDLMPHGHCYLWKPEIVWLHAASDAVIAASYYFIPLALIYFVRKRRDLPFHWMFLMFGIFILGCGTTHIMEIWTLWHGTYRLAGVFKAVTAMASVATAIALVPLIPRAIALPSPEQLKAANEELARTTERVQALSASHVNRIEEERLYLSREIHDQTSQTLIGIKLGLKTLARQMPEDLPELSEQIQRLRVQVNESATQLKNMARRLRPPTLDQLGLNVALEQLAIDYEQHTGMRITLQNDAAANVLPDDSQIAVFRIAQEAITNAAVHGGASNVWLHLSNVDRGLKFEIRDDGSGFDPKATARGMGLMGMSERADMLGGDLSIESQKGEGATITVVIPSRS